MKLGSLARKSSARLPEQPGIVLRRLLVVHEQLPLLCGDGGLDEGASLEELAENILYFYDSQHEHSVKAATEVEPRHATNQAVQFAGICSALRSLPSAFQEGFESIEATSEVRFMGATLVFIPLEPENLSIIAIAQIDQSNASETDVEFTKAEGYSTVAIRMSIQRCHKFFCLLRGGIHVRLGQKDIREHIRDESDDNEVESMYPGVTKLYSYRKQLRRLKAKLSKRSPKLGLNHEDTAQKITSLQEKIQELLAHLPIRSLRADLRSHYDDYLIDAGLVAAWSGICYRSLIDGVTAPILPVSASIAREFPPCSPSVVASIRLGKTLQTVCDRSRDKHDKPVLLGITTFYHRRVLYTHRSSNPYVKVLISVSNETASLLLAYFVDYRHKIVHQSQRHAFVQEAAASRFNRRFRHTMSGGRFDEEGNWSHELHQATIAGDGKNCSRGEFFCSPPLSTLNASDRVLDVHVAGYGSIWTPEVLLPARDSQEQNARSCEVRANVILYEQDGYSFLLYMQPPCHTNNPQQLVLACDDYSELSAESESERGLFSSFPSMLESIAETIDDALESIVDELDAPSNRVVNLYPVAPGQDIIFLNRQTQELVFLTDRCSGANHADKKGAPVSVNRSTRPNGSTHFSCLRLDCRHVLATQLPPDLLDAFDDAMDEVLRRRQNSRRPSGVLDGSVGGAFELCTYLRQGWLYAHADHDKELYALFDPREYVTISDAQKAAERMREQLFFD